jgi:peptidoglycan/LPS O-acetylase OafA/YrhL
MSLVSVLTALVILGLVSPRETVLGRLLSFAPLVWIGQISYGVYLWHFPIFRVMQAFGLRGPVVLTAGGALTFAIAGLSYYVVEKPLLRLKPYPRGELAPADRNQTADRQEHGRVEVPVEAEPGG